MLDGHPHIAIIAAVPLDFTEVLWMFFGPVLLEDGRRRGPTELSWPQAVG